MMETRESIIERTVKNRSLNKAMKVLECFTVENPELGISEICRILKLNKSNVYDILATFEARGYVHKDPVTSKYSLYNAVLRLAGVINKTRLSRDEISILVRNLAKDTRETIYYGIIYDNHVMYLDYMSSSTGVVPMQFIGVPAPLHCTATGKALLATLSNSEVEEIIALGLKRFTENTHADSDSLLNELDIIRKRGYSVDNMEHEYGIKGVGMAIKDAAGHPIAAVSVSGPSLRFDEDSIIQIASTIKHYRDTLSLGMLH